MIYNIQIKIRIRLGMKCKNKNPPHYKNFLPQISINWIHPTKSESKV